MKIECAVRHLRTFMWMVQRVRDQATDQIVGLGAIPREEAKDQPGLHITTEMLEDLMPWIFGDRCVLTALDQILSRYDKHGTLAPIDYYNMMIILDRFLGTVKAFHPLFDRELPEEQQIPDGPPSPMLMRGWD